MDNGASRCRDRANNRTLGNAVHTALDIDRSVYLSPAFIHVSRPCFAVGGVASNLDTNAGEDGGIERTKRHEALASRCGQSDNAIIFAGRTTIIYPPRSTDHPTVRAEERNVFIRTILSGEHFDGAGAR